MVDGASVVVVEVEASVVCKDSVRLLIQSAIVLDIKKGEYIGFCEGFTGIFIF